MPSRVFLKKESWPSVGRKGFIQFNIRIFFFIIILCSFLFIYLALAMPTPNFALLKCSLKFCVNLWYHLIAPLNL